MRLLATAAVLCTCLGCAGAAEPTYAPPPPGANGWTRSLRLGFYASSVVESNGSTSRDTTISSAVPSVSARGKAEGALDWIGGRDSADNRLLVEYGQERQDDGQGSAEWIETIDQLRYDGVFRRVLGKPHFLYLGGGLETSFTGPAPESAFFDPGRVWLSTGYGQFYDHLASQDRLEWRVGVRAQRRYSLGAYRVENRVEVGPEGFARYQRALDERLSFFGQYEVYSEFIDLGHVTNLITAGLTAKLVGALNAELAFRAYYESRPEEGAEGEAGYDEWSMRQDSMIGLAMEF